MCDDCRFDPRLSPVTLIALSVSFAALLPLAPFTATRLLGCWLSA